jgi:hypothetical protein
MVGVLALGALAAPGYISAQDDGEDTTPPRVVNKKLNDPEVSDLLEGQVLRLEVRCNEPCILDAQLVLRGEILGGDQGRVRAGRKRTVLRLALNSKGRRIVRRDDPKKLNVGIRAEDLAGNAVKTDRYRPRN